MENKSIKCGKLTISNKSTFTLIAGPCQLESEEHALEMASKLKEITQKIKIELSLPKRIKYIIKLTQNIKEETNNEA